LSAIGSRTPNVRDTIFLLLGVGILIAALWHARHFYSDDAFISLRYAARLIAGDGLTWTDGERVEGFSNPLWVLLSALLGSIGVPLVAATRILGLASLAGLVALFISARAWPFAFLLFASLPGLGLWTLGGLETVGFAFWLAWGVWLLSAPPLGELRPGRAAAAGLAFAAAALTRPEGILVGLVCTAALPWVVRANRAAFAAFAVAFLLPAAAYEGFRIAYYGAPVTNVALAKGAGLSVARRLSGTLHYLEREVWCWAPIAVCAVAVLFAARSRRSALIALLVLPLAASIVFAAGDYMPQGRLLVPIAVLLAFGIGITANRLPAQWQTVCATLAIAGTIAQGTAQFTQPVVRDSAAAVGAPVGRFLEQGLAPGSLVALATAGSTPYYAPSLRFLDTIGLNDRHIARRPPGPLLTRLQLESGHIKGDGGYVLTRAPDVIVLGPAEGYLGAVPNAWFLTDYELLGSPAFRADYRPFGFLIPVTAMEAQHPRVRELLGSRGGGMRFTAYLRLDSQRARDFAEHGHLLAAPWERAAADSL